ncbi:MAG TPA: hypothetical protein VMR18_02660 [Candidatus Saccharimonadales bacterium]|jgi:ammonia channel protein AmtB|nr:hypothetical protein [Candidatus Saccharimonadales bacterium]
MKKFIFPGLVILGLIFLALAIYYWVTPAGSLPHFMPGYQAGSKHVHLKHGLAALVLAIGCGILAWFQSGKKKPTSASDKSES